MRSRLFLLMITAAIFSGCSNGDASEEKNDSANTLSDTFPAGANTIALDSNPPDATHVDSLNNMSH